MGILDRFEKGLENVVNGAFAKAFRSQVEPVELAGALRREADNKAAVISRGRTLTANHYTIELSPTDHERLSDLESELRSDLRQVIGDHAIEQAYSFVGPVSVDFALADDLDTGMYRVVSTSTRACTASCPRPSAPTAARPHSRPTAAATTRPPGPIRSSASHRTPGPGPHLPGAVPKPRVRARPHVRPPPSARPDPARLRASAPSRPV